jgi:hypothetical protein
MGMGSGSASGMQCICLVTTILLIADMSYGDTCMLHTGTKTKTVLARVQAQTRRLQDLPKLTGPPKGVTNIKR